MGVPPQFPGDPDPASSPERCTYRGGSVTRATVRADVVCWGQACRHHRLPRRPGPRLHAGAVHVAWRQRYPGDRAGSSFVRLRVGMHALCVMVIGVSAPSTSQVSRTLLSRRSDARSVESALPGRPCGTLLCDGDRRVGSILIPRVPDPTSSPERCTMRGGGITRATVREAVSCGCV